MKLDASLLGTIIEEYEVCVIGSGPAGLTVALELMHSGQKICVVESGFLTPDIRENEDLKEVDSHGILIRPDSRERLLGGTSETWSGFIAPLDNVDFEPLPGIHDGWPIASSEIAKYLDARGARYGIPPSADFQNDYNDMELTQLPGVESKTFRVQLRPLRYRKAFEHVFLSPSVDLLYGATVASLVLRNASCSAMIDGVRIVDKTGQEHILKAKTFVLAASAIESARIALHSNIPDPHDQIGRNFMNHPKGNIARVHFSKPIRRQHPLFQTKGSKFARYIGLRLTMETQAKHGLLNPYFRLEPSFAVHNRPRAERLSKSFKNLKKRRNGAAAADTAGLVWSVLKEIGGLPGVAMNTFNKLKARKQRFVSSAVVRCFADMEPRNENRISLSDKADRFGVPIPIVKHTTSALSATSVKRLLDDLQAGLKSINAGIVQPYANDLASLLENDASHHLGGLRMGSDTTTSVVDTDLRFHTVHNLYAAGGAVFPTGGSANPTMTVIGLSIRLAEKIRRNPMQMQSPARSLGSKGFLIVGSGRRIREDVVPVIEKLSGAHISGIFSTSKQALFGLDDVYDVNPLSAVTESDVAASKYIYLAVPPKSVGEALKLLTRFECASKILIVDTPAVVGADLGALYERFEAVTVAEDCAFLPWLRLLEGWKNPITKIDFDQSAYAYHAIALGRAIASNGERRPSIIKVRSKQGRVEVELSNKAAMTLIGPRDYKKGRILLQTDRERIGSHFDAGIDAVIEPIVTDHRCVGFRYRSHTVWLTSEHTLLAGSFMPGDTIVSRMLDIKRVGLHLMLSEVITGKDAYTLSEGFGDFKAGTLQ